MTDELDQELLDLAALFDWHADRLEAMKQLVEKCRNDVEGRLAELGRGYAGTGDRRVSLETAKRLYWNHPRIRERFIARALGVGNGQVHQLVGNSYPVYCEKCGSPTGDRRTSRSSPNRTSGFRICEQCATAEWAKHRRECEEEEKRRDEDRAARLEQQRRYYAAGGYFITAEGHLFRRGEETDDWEFNQHLNYHACRNGCSNYAWGEYPARIMNPLTYGLDEPIRILCPKCGAEDSIIVAKWVPPVEEAS